MSIARHICSWIYCHVHQHNSLHVSAQCMSCFRPIYAPLIWFPHNHNLSLSSCSIVHLPSCYISSPFLLPVILYYIESFSLASRSIHRKRTMLVLLYEHTKPLFFRQRSTQNHLEWVAVRNQTWQDFNTSVIGSSPWDGQWRLATAPRCNSGSTGHVLCCIDTSHDAYCFEAAPGCLESQFCLSNETAGLQSQLASVLIVTIDSDPLICLLLLFKMLLQQRRKEASYSYQALASSQILY